MRILRYVWNIQKFKYLDLIVLSNSYHEISCILLENTLDWKQWMMSYLQTGGQYASIVILVVWMLKLTQRLLAVLSIKKQGFNWRTAVMLNFNLQSQVRKTILRNLPAPTPPVSPDVRPAEAGTETLLLTESTRT